MGRVSAGYQVSRRPSQVDGRREGCRLTDLAGRGRSSDAARMVEAPSSVQAVLGSNGTPVDRTARAFLEPRFGHDFSRVRVHTDQRAEESSRAIDALAYTVGNEIAFASGQYRPDTPGGLRLLAHELAHVVQQRPESRTPSRLGISLPGDNAEREANAVAGQLAAIRGLGRDRGQHPVLVLSLEHKSHPS